MRLRLGSGGEAKHIMVGSDITWITIAVVCTPTMAVAAATVASTLDALVKKRL